MALAEEPRIPDFTSVWPDIAKRVTAGLRARGVPADVAEDAVQEAAARALRTQLRVDSADDLARWTFTVAWRVVVDGNRRRLVTVPLDTDEHDAATVTSTPDAVEQTAIARLDLARVTKALKQLRVIDRTALLRTVGDHGVDAAAAEPDARRDRQTDVRDAVRLHRARVRLTDIVGRLAGVLGVPLRKLWRLLGVNGPSAAATAAAVVLGVVSGWQVVPHSAPAEAAPPPRAEVVMPAQKTVSAAADAAPLKPPASALAAAAPRRVDKPVTTTTTTTAPAPKGNPALNRQIAKKTEEVADEADDHTIRFAVGGLGGLSFSLI